MSFAYTKQAITSIFAVMNVYTGDQAKLTLQVAEWCHYLDDLPIYAIRKAAGPVESRTPRPRGKVLGGRKW